jgi:hypothetical protein
MSSYEYRSTDLAGHDTFDSLEEVEDALRRSRWLPIGAIGARIERREIGPWEVVYAPGSAGTGEPR